MDSGRFDDAVRRLAGTVSRRGALAGLAALAAGAAETAAKKNHRRRKRCTPACAAGQSCHKGGCRCDDGGAVCGQHCCLLGQRCEGGQCVGEPEPGQCVPFGQTCKNVGVPCCAGFVCGSGQGGGGDVACYVPAGGACAATAECTYGSACQDGRCVADPQPTPAPTPPACESTIPVTGDPVADGAALAAAWAAANGTTGMVITLAAGTYAIPTVSGTGLFLSSGEIVVQSCPGEAVTIAAAADPGELVRIGGGTATFRNVTFDADGASGGLTVFPNVSGTPGSLALETCSLTNVPGPGVVAFSAAAAASVRIDGGSFDGNSISLLSVSGGVYTCSGAPVTGVCAGGPGGTIFLPSLEACGCDD